MKLFDVNDNSDDENISKIEINQEFARRYEHNKQREDLHRLQDLKKKGVVSDSSDSESSSEDEQPVLNDIQFVKVLLKVRKEGALLKDLQEPLFESDEENGDNPVEKKAKMTKPKYLKDVAAKHAIENGAEFDESDEDQENVKTYVEGLEETRREILDAIHAEENDVGEGELLKMKNSKLDGNDDEEDEDGGEYNKLLNDYFRKKDDNDKLDENEKFLKDFMKNSKKLLKENENHNVDDFDVSEDEEEIERQEEYEREFNFRFEENAGDRILGHSRVVEGSVRKKTNARKMQRERKEERMAQAKVDRDEEVKHLKNLHKKMKNEKLKKIWEVAGIEEGRGRALNGDYIDEEFNPDEHDKKMGEMFDDDYYGAKDADPKFGSDEDDEEIEKPDFGKEDELLGLPKGWDDVYGSGGDGFSAVREKKLKQKLEKVEEEEDEEDEDEGETKKKRKRSSLEEEVVKKEMEEYYKLDYEGTIGDLKTRFKYRPVNAKRYGLKTEDVLVMDDKELNQYVSLKKLAPYREKEWKVPRIKTYSQKLKNKSLIEGETSIDRKRSKKSGDEVKRSSKSEKPQVDESNGDNQSRRSKRRHRQSELKISQSRLKSYGKIDSTSKSKKKHDA